MVEINGLPVEILSRIFDDVLILTEDTNLFPYQTFPFNVASVCTLWLAILKCNSDYWQSRQWVIDVAEDPAPFLDTLPLSFSRDDGMGIDIIVTSSLKNDTTEHTNDEEGKHRSCENTRTHRVFKHLESSLERCRKITFDVVFQSSLPSPIHILGRDISRLEALTLTCTVHDRDDEGEILIEERPSAPNTDFPSLAKLSLTGYCFMELAQLEDSWMKSLGIAQEEQVQISIHHFKFRRNINGEPCGSRTLEKFVASLESITIIPHISLSDLSLGYELPAGLVEQGMLFSFPHASMDNVSADFVSAFFLRAVLGP